MVELMGIVAVKQKLMILIFDLSYWDANIVKMVVNNPDHEFPSWYDGAVEVDESLGNAADCQVWFLIREIVSFEFETMCQNNPECDFWSYEFENCTADLFREARALHCAINWAYHECFLKEALTDPDCQGYRIWPFEDPHWQGASGPKICPDSATDSSSNDEILDTLSHVQNELNAIFLSSDCVKTG